MAYISVLLTYLLTYTFCIIVKLPGRAVGEFWCSDWSLSVSLSVDGSEVLSISATTADVDLQDIERRDVTVLPSSDRR